MNPSEPNDPLSRMLASWRVTPRRAPGFRPAVWERIRERSRETWAHYVRGHLVGWGVAAVVAVAAAGWTGHSLASTKLAAERDQMVSSYLGELDPRVIAAQHP
jgi:hypothetical protein